MKPLLSLVCCMLLSTLLISQPAPDFTVTDVPGNTHKLYEDYLNQGKTVLIKLFFTTCPPCQSIAPSVQQLYVDWGAGANDVQFFEITIRDFETDSMFNLYSSTYGITFPGITGAGGASNARTPYLDGTYGQYQGTPTFIVIAPNGMVNYNIRGSNINSTIMLLDQALAATGAIKPGTGGNLPPITRNASETTAHNTARTIQLEFFGQDNPVDSSMIFFDPASGTTSNGGTFAMTNACPACVLYTPANGFSGLDQINYFVRDTDNDTSNVSTISVTVDEPIMMDSMITISGNIRNSQGELTIGIININNGTNLVETFFNSSYSYTFSSADIDLVKTYTITVEKDGDPLEGVSATDLVSIQKHLLGIEPFSNNFQRIAADANNNGSTSAADMVVIKKILLGVDSAFPNLPSWQYFTQESINQSQQQSTITIDGILNGSQSGNFVAIKTGDVNGQ